MKDIQEMYRKRVFDELTPVQFDELLLGEIDELNPPIKIGSLEFKASEIIKKLRPEALENNEFLVALFEGENWYERMMIGLDNTYCWLYPPTDENGEYLKYEGVNPEKDWSFFRWQGCHRIMRESKIYFLQEYKNILLQENQNDLLQEVKKELQHCLKHEDPVEIEIYSEDKKLRKFLNSNGEFSFRAVEKPETQDSQCVITTKEIEMKKFRVEVCRISYGFNEIEVEAETPEKAKEIALEEAGNYLYSESHADYKTDGVTEKEA